MKMKLTNIAVACLFCAWPARAETNTNTTATAIPPERISLYKVPLVCPAAPQIGCGSRAKPLLLALEKAPPVAEAWLNRGGTVVAVVWQPEAKRKDRTATFQAISQQEELEARELRGTAKKKALNEFLAREGWHRGGDVDRLSEEEAGVIATRWVRRLQAKTTVAADKAEGLRAALTEGLKKCLTGKAAMPESDEKAALELRRVAGPFLDDEQLKLLGEAAGGGMRAMPNEE